MEQLSSCYFCGGALDVSLSEYPVVPKRLRSANEESKTVVLCQSCRRKLGTILEPVVEATGGEPAGDGDQSAEMDGAGIDAQLDPAGISDANETEDHPFDDENEWESAADREAAKADDAAPVTEGDTESTSSGEADAVTDGEAEPTAESDETTNDDPELTRLEYSKVMRLLENRQFPVDKAEIREVAESAYDIDPGEFDAVVDAAVERGLIGEENGQFVEGK